MGQGKVRCVEVVLTEQQLKGIQPGLSWVQQRVIGEVARGAQGLTTASLTAASTGYATIAHAADRTTQWPNTGSSIEPPCPKLPRQPMRLLTRRSH